MMNRTIVKIGVLAFVISALSPTVAAAGDSDWFKWVDAEVGYDVLPDSSIDCADNGNDVDGKRHVASHATVEANVYESQDNRFQLNAKLWEHVSCDPDFNAQAYGGPGISLRYRLWAK